MHYKEENPVAELRPFIKCFWVLDDRSSTKNQPLQKILPDACPELIIHYGDPFRIKEDSGKIKKQTSSFIFGPLTKHIEIGATGKTGMIAARFFPGALAAFVNIPVKQITNKYVSLEDLFGTPGLKLQQSVCKAKTAKERKKLVERFLIMRIEEKKFNTILPQKTLEHIADKEKWVDVEGLSSKLNIGRRHLERKFNEQIGMTPKLFLKIVRFQNVFKILNSGKIKNLTDLTYRAGYFDQSHFNRDFKQFTGHSPGEHFREDALLTKLFTSGS